MDGSTFPSSTVKAPSRWCTRSTADSFEDTTLEATLARLGVGRVVVTGAQTDACVRATHIEERSVQESCGLESTRAAWLRQPPSLTCVFVVPGTGLEPVPTCVEGGLSPPRLPIPPPGLLHQDRLANDGEPRCGQVR